MCPHSHSSCTEVVPRHLAKQRPDHCPGCGKAPRDRPAQALWPALSSHHPELPHQSPVSPVGDDSMCQEQVTRSPTMQPAQSHQQPREACPLCSRHCGSWLGAGKGTDRRDHAQVGVGLGRLGDREKGRRGAVALTGAGGCQALTPG